LVTCRNC